MKDPRLAGRSLRRGIRLPAGYDVAAAIDPPLQRRHMAIFHGLFKDRFC